MFRRFLLVAAAFFIAHFSEAQSYRDSIENFQHNYAERHEVVTGDDKKYFRFYPVDSTYCISANVDVLKDGKLVTMETSGWMKKTFREYAIASFMLHDTLVRLTIYQPQALPGSTIDKAYLFLPFTDATSGEESYAAGRYLDLNTADMQYGKILLDFNKTYNPYCAFVSGKYNCPVPPAANHLPVAITAGEKKFALPAKKEK